MELNQNGIWNSSWKNVTWNHHLGPTSLLVPHHDGVHHKTGGLHDSRGGRWFGHIRFHWFIGSPDDGKEKMGSNPTARTTQKKNNWESLLPVDRDFLETRMWKILRLLSTVSTKVRWLFWSFNAIPNIQSVVAWDDPKHGQTRSDPCTGSKYCRWWANPLKNMSIRQLGPIYPKIGFNIKFDIKHLFYSAFELDQTGSRNFHDIHSAPGGRRYPRCLARKQE